MNTERAELNGTDLLKTFVLGGKATFTLENTNTGNHLTFKVNQPKEDGPHFVKVLTGPNNGSDYAFLGTIFSDGNYRHGKKSTIGQDARSAKTFTWFWGIINGGRELPAVVKFYHEGSCCRCGRPLTTPESVKLGMGPVCADKA
jgi:hypothetical protein